MKILKVIHGYPPRYNAGSEVYSQTLCHGLAESHEVHVFTREEDVFKPDYAVHNEIDPIDSRCALHVINLPRMRNIGRYRHKTVDATFDRLLAQIQPDIVHVGHLNHLSTSLLEVIASKGIPTVYTLHDYWLMCPRGQFLQRNSNTPWQLCDGQDDAKCAQQCFRGFFSGSSLEEKEDVSYWTDWVHRRMDHIRAAASLVDLFIAPSRYLLKRYRDEFGVDENKLAYLDYGFDLERLRGRKRANNNSELFVFGYIGTHIPAKGIQDLVLAFGQIKSDCKLRIWGRPREETPALKNIVLSLSQEMQERIEWYPEYANHNIVADVFNHVDAIVVPSIWVENSPLVIHEALQVRVPVITANVGGMSEYVHHEVNGLLFQHRDVKDLVEQMERLVKDPQLAARLGARGYIQSKDGNTPDIKQHVRDIEHIYYKTIEARGK